MRQQCRRDVVAHSSKENDEERNPFHVQEQCLAETTIHAAVGQNLYRKSRSVFQLNFDIRLKPRELTALEMFPSPTNTTTTLIQICQPAYHGGSPSALSKSRNCLHQASLTVHVVRIETTFHYALDGPVHDGQGESTRNRVVAEDIG
jgi:hypothetical protein